MGAQPAPDTVKMHFVLRVYTAAPQQPLLAQPTIAGNRIDPIGLDRA